MYISIQRNVFISTLDRHSSAASGKRRGASILPYAMIVGIISITALGALKLTGSSVNDIYLAAGAAIGGEEQITPPVGAGGGAGAGDASSEVEALVAVEDRTGADGDTIVSSPVTILLSGDGAADGFFGMTARLVADASWAGELAPAGADLNAPAASGGWSAEVGIPESGSLLARMISGQPNGEVRTARIEILSDAGAVIGYEDWVISAADDTPDTVFSTFGPAPRGAVYETPPVIVSGISRGVIASLAPDAPISATMSVAGGAFDADAKVLNPGDTISFRVEASADLLGEVSLPFEIGAAAYDVPVRSADDEPDPLVMLLSTAPSGGKLSFSSLTTATGFDVAIPLTISLDPGSIAAEASDDLTAYGAGAFIVTGPAALLSNADLLTPSNKALFADAQARPSSVMLAPGDQFRVAMVSGPETGAQRIANITLGDPAPAHGGPDASQSSQWALVAHDTIPDEIAFIPTLGHVPGTRATSIQVQVTGISTPAPVQAQVVDDAGQPVAPAFFRTSATLGGGGSWRSSGSVSPFQYLTLSTIVAQNAEPNNILRIAYNVGGVSGEWLATVAGADRVPDPFTISDTLEADPLTRVQAAVGLSGFDAQTSIWVEGDGAPMVSIANGAFQTATQGAPAPILPGQTVSIETESGDFLESRQVVVHIGQPDVLADQVFSVWTVETRAQDITPVVNFDALSTIPPASIDATIAENLSFTPTSYSDPIDIVLSGANAADTEVSVSGGAWVSTDGGATTATMTPGQTLRIRHKVKTADGVARSVTIALGDATPFEWTIPTLDATPDPIIFLDQENFFNIGQSWWTSTGTTQNSSNERQQFIVSGLSDGLSVPVSLTRISGTSAGAVRITPTLGTTSGAYITSTVKNGDIIAVASRFQNEIGGFTDFRLRIGGYETTVRETTLNGASIVRGAYFDAKTDAVANQKSYSNVISPFAFQPNIVTVTIENTAEEPSARIEKSADGGITFGAPATSVSFVVGDSLRVSVDQENAASKSVDLSYNTIVPMKTKWTTSLPNGGDATPDSFVFTRPSQTLATSSTSPLSNFIISPPSTILLSGFDKPFPLRVRNVSDTARAREYSVNGLVRHSLNADGIWATDFGYTDETTIDVGQRVSLNLFSFQRLDGETIKIVAESIDPATGAVTGTANTEIIVPKDDTDPDQSGMEFVPASIKAPPSIYVNSPQITMPDVTGLVKISISGHPSAEFRIGNGAWTSQKTWRSAGSPVQVRLMSGGAGGETRQATLTVEGRLDDNSGPVSRTSVFTVFTADTTPDPIAFAGVTGAEPQSLVRSGEAVISGLADGESTTMTLTGSGSPLMSVWNGVDFGPRTSSANLSNGDRVVIWLTSSQETETTVSAALASGGFSSDPFSVTTRAFDATPDVFGFSDANNADPDEVLVSQAIVVDGFADAAPVEIITPGVEVEVAGEPFTAAPAEIYPGQSVRLKWAAPSEVGASATATLRIGGVEGSWTVSTAP